MPLQNWAELGALNPQLQSLEDLAALSKDYGLVEIKPFRDWKASPYQHKIFKLRLLNAGETLDVTQYTDQFPGAAKIQATRLEFVIRSIWSIDDRKLLTDEEIAAYNRDNHTSYTILDYLRMWSKNLEQTVIERMEFVYNGLTYKQMRQMQGVSLCEHCQNTFTEVPAGSRWLKYSLGEIICNLCLPLVDVQDYDFADVTEVKPQALPQTSPVVPISAGDDETSFGGPNGYRCVCGEDFDSLEDFARHRETCAKAGAVRP